MALLPTTAFAGVYDKLSEPFAASPEELRAAAEAVTKLPLRLPSPSKKKDDEEKPPTVELLASVRISFDDAGMSTTTRHDIWRIERDDTSLRTGTMYWDPWREHRPAVDLRVVSPDGRERKLDPATLVEQSVATGLGEMYVDTRKLIAPLPGARKGAIVEQLDTVVQEKPFLTNGQSGLVPVGTGRAGRVEVVLDAPIGLPLRFDSKNLGEPKEVKRAGRRTISWIVDEPALVEWPPDFAPHEAYNVRYVSWSTAPDWGSLARAYAALVDEAAILPPEAIEAAREIRKRETDDRRAATAMARWFNDRARYAAVELGAAAVVPRAPAEVLARGYGDCKDKATFLAAMLRSVGITAHVALLRAGWDPDVNPKLPGPNLFNHAITVLDGGKQPIWVDPTQPEHPAGLLPDADADRWALIAAPDTTSLTRTPPAQPMAVDITKIITAVDLGGATIEQRTRVGPAGAAATRDQVRTAGIEAIIEEIEAAAKKSWRAREATASYEIDLDDLDRDVTEVVMVTGAEELSVRPGEFSVKTGPGFAMSALPTKWALGLGEDVKAKRTWPVVLRGADETATLEIHPPRGYTLASTPEAVDIALTGGRFTWTWAPLPDGGIRADAHLVVPTAVAVERVDEFVRAADEVRKKSEMSLRFQNPATRLSEAGKVSASLREWSALATATDALLADRVGWAQALFDAGYARKAQAVLGAVPETEATRDTFFLLGWDSATRPPQGFGVAKGFDPDPYRTRLRVAVEQAERDESDNAQFYRELLGRFLVYDAQGVYGRGDVEAALALWATDDEPLPSTRAIAIPLLLSLGDGERVKDLTRYASDDARRGQRVAAFFLADGMDAALREARELAGDGERLRSLYRSAASALSYARQYDGARSFTALVPDSDEGKDLPPSLRRHDTIDWTADEPVAAVRRFLRAAGDPAFHKELPGTFAAAALDEAYEPWSRNGSGLTDYLLDKSTSPRTVEVDGDAAGGFRLRWEAIWSPTPFRYYVVREKGQYKLRSDGFDLDELGEEAGARLDAGKLAEAQRWLDWALLDTERPAPSRLKSVWTADGDRSLGRARLMVALITAGDHEGDKHLKTLREAWSAKTADAAVGPALWAVLARTGATAEALAVADEMRTRGGDAQTVNPLRITALARLGRVDEAEAEARSALGAAADTADHWSAIVSALSDAGAFDPAVRLGREGVARFPKDPGLLNQATWPMLFLPSLPEDALTNAEHILDGPWSSGRAHTSACVFAAGGRTDEARKLVKTYIEDHNGDLDPSWSFVWGRIAEADGLPEEARAAYLLVTDDTENAASTGELARRRLALLPPAPPPAKRN
ncbi:hypothetical protein LBMAG42_30180 [Deltaproteobacteria bacterium]|nr:hypothetical protein LBMAG42_30180 [Deltaproteobacteria bacterium]